MVQIRVVDQIRDDLHRVSEFCQSNKLVIDANAFYLIDSIIERFAPDIWVCSTMTFVETKYRVMKLRDLVSVCDNKSDACKILQDIAFEMDNVQFQLIDFAGYTLAFPISTTLCWYSEPILSSQFAK